MSLGFISHVAWSSDGGSMAAAHGGGVGIWRGGFGGTPDLQITDHGAPVKWVAYAPQNHILATTSSDTTVRLWNSRTAAAISTLHSHKSAAECATFDYKGALLATASSDKTICVYDFAQSGAHMQWTAHTNDITALAFNKAGILASGSWDNSARLWDTRTGRERCVLMHDGWIRALTFTPDGAHLVTACKDGAWHVWNVETHEKIRTVFAHDGGVDCLAYSPDGLLLATGGRDNMVKLWDAANGALLATLYGHDKPVLTLAFHPAGQFLVTGSGDNTLRLWAVSS
jgi:WD40 repeat protein